MKKIYSLAVILCAALAVDAQEDLSVNSYWPFNGDMSNALYSHICDRAFAQLKERKSLVDGLKSRGDWIARQAEAKRIMEEMVGKFPEKTPLNPVITGRLKRDGFIVEKLYFESMPGYYVTAALFLPADRTGKTRRGKHPAIVYCCGHSRDGFRSPGYQRVVMNLVKKGFIVLAFDPIGQGERIQYFDPDGNSIFGPTHEHSYPGTQSFISGRSPAHYFIWDGIRAVDYLVGRPEVDATRIGITGRSGGGTQSAYIAAMDDRILASAPECYITSYDMLLRSRGPQDAEQILKHSLKNGFDLSDLIEIRAPKPTLLIATTNDIFSIQGTRDVFGEARRAYAAHGLPENVMMVEDDAGHSSTKKNREAMYAFFQKFLNHPGEPTDEDVELFAEQELWVTPTGQLQTSLKGETLFTLNQKFTDEALEQQTEKRNNPDFHKDLVRTAKQLTGYSEPEPSSDYIFSGRLWRDGYSIEKYLIKGPGNYYIPLLHLSPENHGGKTVLLLDDKGKASAAERGGLAEKLAQNGYQVIAPDLNGFGELSGGYRGGDAVIRGVILNIWYAGILTHKSPLAVRTEEIKLIVDFIKQLGKDGAEISLTGIASGTLTADLLHAAMFSGRFDRIALLNPLISYLSIVREKNYHPKFAMSAPPGVIGKYDLSDITAALSPMKIFMLNPVNSMEQTVSSDEFERMYADTQNLTVLFDEENMGLKLVQLLK